MARVVLENLVKTYPDKKGRAVAAVKGINLSIADGEFMVLVGPSGCGKSTTLRMVAGLEAVTSGTVAIDGRVVNEVPPKDRDIAMVFQNYALYPHMTAYENMAFGLKLRKTPAAEIAARVREAAALLGLEELLDRRPKALSGGQRQRVAVGRAIVRQPKVFLFDEPLSNLDAQMRVQMRAEISRIHDRLATTMIYVTHDQVEAMTMGDRICVMKDGEIQQCAAPLELYNRPANLFTAGFIGSPAMNILRGRLERREGGLYFVEQAGQNAASFTLRDGLAERAARFDGPEILLGIRPENIAAQGSESSAPVSTGIELIEPMGAETHLHARTAGHTLVARVPPGVSPARGSQIVLHLDLAQALLFDPKSGRAV